MDGAWSAVLSKQHQNLSSTVPELSVHNSGLDPPSQQKPCQGRRTKIRSHLGTLALKTGNSSKNTVVLLKRKNGFTKTIPSTENPGKIRRRAF